MTILRSIRPDIVLENDNISAQGLSFGRFRDMLCLISMK